VQIQGIVGTKISGIAAAIAAAVQQQSTATQEIARNVQDVASGTGEVSVNISGVNQVAIDTARVAELVELSVRELHKADVLQKDVRSFLTELKAAEIADKHLSKPSWTNPNVDFMQSPGRQMPTNVDTICTAFQPIKVGWFRTEFRSAPCQ